MPPATRRRTRPRPRRMQRPRPGGIPQWRRSARVSSLVPCSTRALEAKPAELAAGEERAAAKAVAVGFDLVDETGREAVPKPATLDGERESQWPESRDAFDACDPL